MNNIPNKTDLLKKFQNKGAVGFKPSAPSKKELPEVPKEQADWTPIEAHEGIDWQTLVERTPKE